MVREHSRWRGGGCLKFSPLTPLFQTHLENKDQGQRAKGTETEWGVLALQARPGCPPSPAYPPTPRSWGPGWACRPHARRVPPSCQAGPSRMLPETALLLSLG